MQTTAESETTGTAGDTEGPWGGTMLLAEGSTIHIAAADRAKITVTQSSRAEQYPETPMVLKMVLIGKTDDGTPKMRHTRYWGEGCHAVENPRGGWAGGAPDSRGEQIIIFMPKPPAEGDVTLRITRVGAKDGHAGFALAEIV